MNDLDLLIALGARLGDCHARDFLTQALLRIRDRQGALTRLVPNRVQRRFAARCGQRNIVLKARQLGITTYVAAQFFLSTITRPGTLTVQVAHDRESAEQIFRIVHRFLERLPLRLQAGALVTSRDNVGQIVFPRLDSEYRIESAGDSSAGRGSTIQNLHCSEVARWPGDAAATLASLRAAVPAGGTVVLESTPCGAGGVFYDEWQRAEESGYVKHFFPWWFELKAHMRWLVGNGAPGRLQELEHRVEEHEKFVQRAGGIGAAVGVILTLVHLAIDYMRVHAGR